MRVLSSLKAKPRGASHAASCALTWAACCWLWQSATMSSAYLISTGEPALVSPVIVLAQLPDMNAAAAVMMLAGLIARAAASGATTPGGGERQ